MSVCRTACEADFPHGYSAVRSCRFHPCAEVSVLARMPAVAWAVARNKSRRMTHKVHGAYGLRIVTPINIA
jgi:hypothetical protein